jgi:hypothetical protein
MGATRVYEPRISIWNADGLSSLSDPTGSHWRQIPFLPHRPHSRPEARSWSFRAQDLDTWHALQTNMSPTIITRSLYALVPCADVAPRGSASPGIG